MRLATYLVLLDVVGSGCGALCCRMRVVHVLLGATRGSVPVMGRLVYGVEI